jgi:hypothetical protein
MATSNAIASQGTQFQRGNGASPEVFTALGDITNITGLGSGTTKEFEVTHYLSTAVEVRVGLFDEGEIKVEGNYVPSDTQHEGMLSDRDSLATATPILRNFKVVLPAAAKTFNIAAFVKQFEISPELQNVVKFTATLRCSGAITRS